jgi:hypothetical protein
MTVKFGHLPFLIDNSLPLFQSTQGYPNSKITAAVVFQARLKREREIPRNYNPRVSDEMVTEKSVE